MHQPDIDRIHLQAIQPFIQFRGDPLRRTKRRVPPLLDAHDLITYPAVADPLAEMLEVLQSEYVKFARAKGISLRRIYFVHALKNTMLPVITVGGVQIGTLVAYTILTETVFQWPGLGLMFLEAITRSDIPLIVAYLMVVGLIFVVTNTLVDLIYGLVNPTVKLTGKKA